MEICYRLFKVIVITIRYMINSCDTWSTGFHGNDQCEEGAMVALSQMALLIMYEICWSSNDRLLIMDEICWSCNDAAVDRGWNLFIMLWYAIDHGDDMLIVPMIGVLIMHDVLQNYVTMKVIVITIVGLELQFFPQNCPDLSKAHHQGLHHVPDVKFGIFCKKSPHSFNILWSQRLFPHRNLRANRGSS